MSTVFEPVGDGAFHVTILCDVCEQPIRHAADGLAAYQRTPPGGGPGRVVVAHRAADCRGEAEQLVRASGVRPHLVALDEHVYHVRNALRLTDRHLDAVGRRLAEAEFLTPEPFEEADATTGV